MTYIIIIVTAFILINSGSSHDADYYEINLKKEEEENG